MTNDLRYPIGKFTHEGEITQKQREIWIDDIEHLPLRLEAAIAGLSPEQMDTPYREGGWTIRQVTHHVADSHMNCFIRFKLALTEDHPTIKAYDEGAWASLPDTAKAPTHLSLELLRGLHGRWALMLRNMSDSDFAKTFYHPGYRQINRLDRALGTYSWHGRHHVAHITSLRERMGW